VVYLGISSVFFHLSSRFFPKHMFTITNVSNWVTQGNWLRYFLSYVIGRYLLPPSLTGYNSKCRLCTKLMHIPRQQSCLPCFLPLYQHQHLSFYQQVSCLCLLLSSLKYYSIMPSLKSGQTTSLVQCHHHLAQKLAKVLSELIYCQIFVPSAIVFVQNL